MTTPWHSVQDAEKANEIVAWQTLPCREQGGAYSNTEKLAFGACHPTVHSEMAQNAASRFSSIRRESRFGGCGLEPVELTRAEGEGS